jgi:5-formyltetrahydrofolate cyclo-ligase
MADQREEPRAAAPDRECLPIIIRETVEAADLRKAVLEQRRAMPDALRLQFSEAIGKGLLELRAFQEARTALFFVTHGSEVETRPMRRRARELGLAVAVPRCEPSDRSMRFHVLDEPEALHAGPYGILEPGPEAPLIRLDPGAVVLVPGSVFDRRGNRLGMGGGYYDRWLAGEGRGLPTIGLAFHAQLVPEVPVGPLDVPVRWLVTERGVIDCGKFS